MTIRKGRLNRKLLWLWMMKQTTQKLARDSPEDFAEEDEDEELVEDDSFEFLEPPLEGSDSVFGFGLHRGRTFGDVVREYPASRRL